MLVRNLQNSMDSGPTLDVVDGFCDEDEDDGDEIDGGEREVWGRLFPLIDAYSKTGYKSHLLVYIICSPCINCLVTVSRSGERGAHIWPR